MNNPQQSSSVSKRGPLGFAVISLVLSLTPIAFGVVRGIPERQELDRAAIVPESGASFITPLPPLSSTPLLRVNADDPEHPMRSTAQLYEDRTRLGPHSQPALIRNAGRGQFSHWGSTLHFSTSDNSDPRTNGRAYVLVTRSQLPFVAAWLWALLFVAGVAGGWWRVSSRPAWYGPARRTRVLWCVLAAPVAAMAALTTFDVGVQFVPRGSLPAIWAIGLVVAAILAVQSGQALPLLDVEAITASVKAALIAAARLGQNVAADAEARLSNIDRWFNRPGVFARLLRWSILLVPAGAFAAALSLVLPMGVLTSAHNSLTPVVLGAAVALWWCHWRVTWVTTLAALTVTLVLFALPLAALWQDVSFHGSAIGGLLPFSDASGYYYDARRLLDGVPFGWSARRPLYVGMLSTLLALTGQNLQLTLAAFVAMNAVATFLLARELRASHGPVAAALVTVVVFVFYRNEGGLGTTLTENLGLALGTCGFAALLRGARQLDARSLYLGLGLLTLGLISRAGAFFVLPMVVLAIAWMFRGDGRWLRIGAGAAGALLLAAVLALGMGRVLADPATEQTAFSNFSYSLYGVVVGGKGWGQVLQDHPGAREGAEIYSLAYQAFLDRPMGMVEGSLRMWNVYFTPSGSYHAFGFVAGEGANQLHAQTVCYVLSAIALVVAGFRFRRPQYALILAATVGHISSIPLVPPIDAGLRVYAATVPLLAILVGVGIGAVLEFAGRAVRMARGGAARAAPSSGAGDLAVRTAEWFGVVLAAVALAGPLLLLHARRPPPLRELSCPDGTLPVFVRVSEGSFLRITDGREPAQGRQAAVEISQQLLPVTAGRVEIGKDVQWFTAGNTMLNGYDLKSGRYVWLVTPTEKIRQGTGIYAICGHDSPDALSKAYGVFYADQVWRFEPHQRR